MPTKLFREAKAQVLADIEDQKKSTVTKIKEAVKPKRKKAAAKKR